MQAAWEKYVESEAVAPKTPPTFNFPLTVLPHPPYCDTRLHLTYTFALRAEQFSSGPGAELDRTWTFPQQHAVFIATFIATFIVTFIVNQL